MKNKKGMFFLMLTIIVLSLFVLSIGFFSDLSSRKVVQERVESLSGFVLAIENDLNRQIFISGYRSIFFMEKEIVDNGDYLNTDANSLLQEMFFNGSIYTQPEPLLQATTFSELEQLVSERAAKIGATVSFANPTINITQEDPWNVNIIFTSDFYVVDDNNLASWNKTLLIDVPIAISNFTDPIYSVGTGGQVAPTFAQTPYASFGVSNLSAHITGGYYRENTEAPSFIGRLEGNFAASPYGIESLVNVENIPASFQQSGSKSIADYIYFEGSGTGCSLAGMNSWVRLDENHRMYYGNIACG